MYRLNHLPVVALTTFTTKEAGMTGQNEEVHIEAEAARAGETPHIVRYVLGFSLTGAVIALALVWYFFR